MNDARGAALAAAVSRDDLPRVILAPGLRVGTLRLGAFAPQYDPVFKTASDRAAKHGADDDKAMLAGFCAVTSAFIARYDTIAAQSDVVVLDLRGNLGGFDRIARLQALAIAPGGDLPRTFDFARGAKPGFLHLTEQKRDPSCGQVRSRAPLVVLDDAATRSSGEFMTAWLWSAGAFVAGERTMGAGGGRASDAVGFALPQSGLKIRLSDLFSIVDPKGAFGDGEWREDAVLARITAGDFAPSRTHPFAFQSVGVRPDDFERTTLADLQDGGRAEAIRAAMAALPRHGAR
jgi:hypothetical protein